MTRPSLLIIDDHFESVSFLPTCLEGEFDSVVVNSGASALGLDVKNFSGFVVDINLPDFSGDELIYELKKKSRIDAFFCLITGMNFEDSLIKNSNFHIDDFLNKDSTAKEIRNRIVRVYKQKVESNPARVHPSQ